MTEHDRAARRRLVWLLLTRGDVGAEPLRSDSEPALRVPAAPPAPVAGRARAPARVDAPPRRPPVV